MRFADSAGEETPGRPAPTGRRWRALFLSDLHLGSRACQSGALKDFLRHHDADTIYLVGDIVDGWRLKAGWYWPPAHNDIFLTLTGAAKNGRRVVYVPGNHDDFLRGYQGTHFAGVEVCDQTIHRAADGRRYLILHGDVCDPLVQRVRRLHVVGYRADRTISALDSGINHVRRRLGLSHRSVSQWAKFKVKTTLRYLSDFERALAALAREQGADGVICGHVHHPAISERFGIRYVNCGDWVASCTAVAEGDDGRFEIIRWRSDAGPLGAAAPTQARAA